jgi:hypothetical protein
MWAPVFIALALAIMASILFSAERRYVQYRRLRGVIESREARLDALRTKEGKAEEVLRGPSVRRLDGQIEFLNGLIDRKRLSLSDMAGQAVGLLPDEARLLTLELQQTVDGPEVSFEVEGQPPAVDAFLANLERSPGFDSPVVKDEHIEQQGPDKGMSVIRCLARVVRESAIADGPGGAK